MKSQKLVASSVLTLLAFTLALPVLPSSAISTDVTLANGKASFDLDAGGSIDSATLYSSGASYLAWAHFAVAYGLGGSNYLYTPDDTEFTVVQGWTASGSAAWAAATGGTLGVVEKAATVPKSSALAWGVTLVNLGKAPLTAVKFYGYMDSDFYYSNQYHDEGHYVAVANNPVRFAVYENNYDGSDPASRTLYPYYGYTFAKFAADGHQWNTYYGAEEDIATDNMAGVKYWFGDGGGVARYTIGTLQPGQSFTIYFVFAMSPGSLGQAGLINQLYKGVNSASLYAKPPHFCFSCVPV